MVKSRFEGVPSAWKEDFTTRFFIFFYSNSLLHSYQGNHGSTIKPRKLRSKEKENVNVGGPSPVGFSFSIFGSAPTISTGVLGDLRAAYGLIVGRH